MCALGCNDVASSNVPPSINVDSGMSGSSPQHRVPQMAHDINCSLFPLCRIDSQDVVSPCKTLNVLLFTETVMPNALPVRRWQSIQWQHKTMTGAFVHWYLSAPHRHPPINGISKLMFPLLNLVVFQIPIVVWVHILCQQNISLRPTRILWR